LALVEIYRNLNLKDIDVLVLSACVQMPSLQAIPIVENECGLPVVSSAVCTTHQMLLKLGLKTYVPGAGFLLSGKFDRAEDQGTDAAADRTQIATTSL
jgi:maleate isomerase